MSEPVIKDVSDTAHWVAIYRTWETARPDALFRDPLVSKLVDERAAEMHKKLSQSRYVYWSVVIRTHIIDNFIEKLLSEGVDTVINLGCGLDTRPYRMSLPENLKWVEVDFPHMINRKEDRLKNEKPKCRLERVSLDLSKRSDRAQLFSRLNSEARKALIITEGVTPYLSNDDVAALADDLRSQSHFKYWITDYTSPELVKFLNNPRRKREMRNAPFIFDPGDWFQFFESHGWKSWKLLYIGEESDKLGRPIPYPLIIKLFAPILKHTTRFKASKRYNGYAILEPK